jgi:hypothetical protein
MPLWLFASEVDPIRVDRLLAVSDFDQVLALVSSATVVGFRWKEFENVRLRGCFRAEYALTVAEDIYDALFNAPVGLRGQYAHSPAQGEAATRRVISLLWSRLLEYSIAVEKPLHAEIQWSLCGVQAKVWIDEKEAEHQLGGVTPQILYEPWQQCSESGVGLLAPRATRLEVKGAWVRPGGAVELDPFKLGRADDIHRTGYS